MLLLTLVRLAGPALAADGAAAAEWTIEGPPGASWGAVIGGAGDFDADGFDDVYVADPGVVRTRAGRVRHGSLQVWLGDAAGPGATAGWMGTLATADAGTGFGTSAAALGDLDGDGDADLAVGAPDGDLAAGAVYVFRGAPGSPVSHPSDVLLGGDAGLQLGTAVAAGGDLDGDGLADLLASAPGYDGSSTDQGAVVAWFGGAALSGSPDWLGTEDLGATMAWSVAGPGDVDGDGYDDVLSSSPMVGEGGVVLLFTGGAAGPGTAAVWRVDGDPSPVSGELGHLVTGAGDTDGDGFADFAVTQSSDLGGTGVWVYSGSAAGPTASPAWIDADGADFTLGGGVAPVGDADGDGYDDLVVAVATTSTREEGVYLYPGGAAGIGAAPLWMRAAGDADDLLGVGLAGAGDPNGDGLPDLLVGDPGAGEGGAVHFYAGPLEDADGDGDRTATDCDDADPDRSTLHAEVCDGIDDDCDGAVDEDAVDAPTWYRDADGDTWGDPATARLRCSVTRGWVSRGEDCDDGDASAWPGAPEVRADGVDQDCDGWDTADTDGDGFAHPLDCDDGDPRVHPGAPDAWYDGVDADCAGDDDWDQDGDGWALGTSVEDCDDTDPTLAPWDCDPTAFVVDGTTVTLSGRASLSSVWIVNGGHLVVRPWAGGGPRGYVRLQADVIYVDPTSTIDASGAGWRGGRAGADGEGGEAGGRADGGGGGNGGAGGGACGLSYEGGDGGSASAEADDATLHFGGGGGGSSYGGGGAGGGGVGLAARIVWIEGSVLADGADAPWAADPFDGASGDFGGGGAGGTISIRADELRCTGALSADGGAPGVRESYEAWVYEYAGGGGGGRILLDAPTLDLGACTLSLAAEPGECGAPAEAGTVWVGG